MNGNTQSSNNNDDNQNHQNQSFDSHRQDSLYPAKWDLSGLFPAPTDDEPAEPGSTDGQSEVFRYAHGDRFRNLSDAMYFSASGRLNRYSNN